MPSITVAESELRSPRSVSTRALTRQERQGRVTREILVELQEERVARRARARSVLGQLKSWLTEAMRIKDMTQVELSVLSGNSPTTVFHMLKGRNVRLTTASEVADALGYRMTLVFEPLQG